MKKISQNQLIKIRNFLLGPSWYKKRHLKADTLDRDPHTINISNEIFENFAHAEDSEGSYVFAISGKWGEGKTDLLERIEPKLLDKRIPVIWFRPWQYTEDSETLRRVYLRKLNTDLNDYRNVVSKIRFCLTHIGFLDKLKYSESTTALNWPLLEILILLLVIFLSMVSIYQILTAGFIDLLGFFTPMTETIKSQPLLAGVVGFLGFSALLLELIKLQRNQSKVSSIDEFEELFNNTLMGFEKIAVFIDDLDRCTPEGVKVVLDSLKTFFRNPKVNYIVTGDHTVLERYLGKQLDVRPTYKEDASGEIDKAKTEARQEVEGKRFLKKLFNVYWRLPLPDSVYMTKLIRENLAKLTNVTQEDKNRIELLMLNFLDKNPREVIRFVEILTFSLKTIDTRISNLGDGKEGNVDLKKNLEEVKSNLPLLAKVLLIQEKFDSEFREFATQPSRYAALEREQLKNKPDVESGNAQKRLADQAPPFFNLVRTSPTFHNDRLVLKHSPDVFFYYSGFAGASEVGVLSEDFLGRYITADQNLVTDLKGTPETRIKDILSSAVANLNQLSDAAQITQAINNLIAIFTADIPPSWDFAISFLDNQKVKEHFNPLPDDQKDIFIKSLSQIIIQSKNPEILKKVLSEDPWKTKKDLLLTTINTSKINNGLLDQIVNDTLADQQINIDITQRKQKILNNHLEVLNSAQSETSGNLRIAMARINKLADNLDLKGLASTQIFGQILQAIRATSDKHKRELLLDFLEKKNSFWSQLPLPSSELRLLNPNSTLRKKSDMGNKVREVYESWYPRRKAQRRKKR